MSETVTLCVIIINLDKRFLCKWRSMLILTIRTQYILQRLSKNVQVFYILNHCKYMRKISGVLMKKIDPYALVLSSTLRFIWSLKTRLKNKKGRYAQLYKSCPHNCDRSWRVCSSRNPCFVAFTTRHVRVVIVWGLTEDWFHSNNCNVNQFLK